MEFGTKPKYEIGTVVYTWRQGEPRAYKIVKVDIYNYLRTEKNYTDIQYVLSESNAHLTEEDLDKKYFTSKTGMIKNLIDKIDKIEIEEA